MGGGYYDDFVRNFYPEIKKQALIIDVRHGFTGLPGLANQLQICNRHSQDTWCCLWMKTLPQAGINYLLKLVKENL